MIEFLLEHRHWNRQQQQQQQQGQNHHPQLLLLPQPFALHAKYSTAFCRRRGRTMPESLKNLFRQEYFFNPNTWQKVCTHTEIEMITPTKPNNHSVCWASLP